MVSELQELQEQATDAHLPLEVHVLEPQAAEVLQFLRIRRTVHTPLFQGPL